MSRCVKVGVAAGVGEWEGPLADGGVASVGVGEPQTEAEARGAAGTSVWGAEGEGRSGETAEGKMCGGRLCEAPAHGGAGRGEARETPSSAWAGQGRPQRAAAGAPPRGEVSLARPDFLPFSCTQKSGFLHEHA